MSRFPSSQLKGQQKEQQVLNQQNMVQNVEQENISQQIGVIQAEVSSLPIRQSQSSEITEKQAKIVENEQKIYEIQTKLRMQKETELNKLKTQLQFKEQKITKHARYFQQAENRRLMAFQQMRKLIIDSQIQSQNFQKQIQQSDEIAKLKCQLLREKQDKKGLQFNQAKLKQEITVAKQIDQKKQMAIEQMQKRLRSLDIEYQKRESERVEQLNNIKAHYKNLQLHFALEITRLEEFKAQLAKQRKSHTEKEKIHRTQMQKRIQNEGVNRNTIQDLQKTKQALQFQIHNNKQEIQILKNSLQIAQKRANQAIQKCNQTEIRLRAEKGAQIERQSVQLRKFYQKKTLQSIESYKKLQKNLSSRYDKQKKTIMSDHFILVQQLSKQKADLLQDKKQIQEKFKLAAANTDKQIKELKAKLSLKQQQVIRYVTIFEEIKKLIKGFANPNQNLNNPQKLPSQISQYIQFIKQAERKAIDQSDEAKNTIKMLVTTCKQNRQMLQSFQNKFIIKQNDFSLKYKERADDSNHLAVTFNNIIRQLNILISQKNQHLQTKQQTIAELRSKSSEFQREATINKTLFAKQTAAVKKLQQQSSALVRTTKIQKAQIQQIHQLIKESDNKLQKISLEKHKLSAYLQQTQKALDLQRIERQKRQSEINQLTTQLTKVKIQFQKYQADLKLKNELNKKLNQTINQLSEQNKTLELKIRFSQAELEKLKQQMKEKEIVLKKNFDQQLEDISVNLCKTIKLTFGNQPENRNIYSIISFLQRNRPNSQNTAFSVSQILQKMPKQRQFLFEECLKIFGASGLSTKLSFKYDQFNKNFSNYVPTPQNKFTFATIMKTKKNVVFGVVTYYSGNESKAFAFNLSTMKIMQKSQRSRQNTSTSYESSMLKFGNEEIIIKNNSNLEIKINTLIIGERYFDFSKENLVGKEDETVVLQAMEVHRLLVI